MNNKLTKLDNLNIQFKRYILQWKIKDIAKRFQVTERTIYRVLRK
jgi:transposase